MRESQDWKSVPEREREGVSERERLKSELSARVSERVSRLEECPRERGRGSE